jgi:hypothetical protein
MEWDAATGIRVVSRGSIELLLEKTREHITIRCGARIRWRHHAGAQLPHGFFPGGRVLGHGGKVARL